MTHWTLCWAKPLSRTWPHTRLKAIMLLPRKGTSRPMTTQTEVGVVNRKDKLYQLLVKAKAQPSSLLSNRDCRIEGLATLKAAIGHGWTPSTIVCGRSQLDKVLATLQTPLRKGQVWAAHDGDVTKLMHQPRLDPVLAQGPIPNHTAVPSWRFGVVLCCQDPYNLGALVRSSLAFGVDAIALWPGAVNAFNHYAIKASAGTVFAAHFLDPHRMLAQAKGTSMAVFRAEAHPTTKPGSWLDAPTILGHREVDLPNDRKRLLVLGHETHGIPLEWQGLGASVHVTMAGDVESLSVNAAGAVLLDRLAF
eukprot:m.39880 g.39880  ORF g.39880 m.39880 type:complete len:306 (+) comp12709_c0_seq1:297-1214(+)